ncbi:MAG: hypothetical protein GF364_11960 [Candidatus Lokiarchaeota archaeon]|nr:hypothetical protein [Candidatus Lokiarchaeota archaeon]
MSDEIKDNISDSMTSDEEIIDRSQNEKRHFKKEEKEKEKKAHKKEVDRLWTEVGWHRPLGGTLYNYVLLLVLAIPALLGASLFEAILPYPEALGFATITTSELGVIYMVTDLGMRNAVERYVSQYSEIQPRKAVSYLSFYIWFQMVTGVMLVTGVSIYAIKVLPNTDLSYAIWFFFVYIMIQWPGTAGIFLAALGGFQQFDKQNVLVVIQNVAIQTGLQILCILGGQAIGRANPEIGELMGAVSGFILGSYLDDLITMLIGAYYFGKTLAPYNIALREALLISFNKEMVKEVLIYGGKVMPSGLAYVWVTQMVNRMVRAWLPAYSTQMGLYTVASGLIGALGITFSMTAPLSESYNNDKKELALLYIRSHFRWWGIISIGILMAPLLFLIPPILSYIVVEYQDVQWMIFPLFVGAFILGPSYFGGVVAEACNIPEHSTAMNFIEQGTRFATYLFVLHPATLTTWLGPSAAYWGWLFAEAPAYTLKMLYGWWIIKKKLFPDSKLQIPYYQTFIAPAVTLIVFVPLNQLMIAIFRKIWAVNEIAAYGVVLLYLILILFIFPMYIFMPIYGLTGAWDKRSLEDFRKAALMSGPSKFIVLQMYKLTKWGHRHSPFHGKFIIPYEKGLKEAKELSTIRKMREAETTA